MLTPKRQKFGSNYALTGNGTQAAIEAGYSERTAKQQGSRLLTFADVRAGEELVGYVSLEEGVGCGVLRNG